MPKQARKHKDSPLHAELSLSAEQDKTIGQALSRVPAIAAALEAASSREEVAAALAELYALGPAMLVAFLDRLARRHERSAMQIAVALAELSESKEVRREARRTLLRLTSAGVRPTWNLPQSAGARTAATTLAGPRFWQGFVSSSRQEGEVNLVLTWDLDGTETRLQSLVFLLDFWNAGLKEAIISAEMSRSQYQRQVLKAPQMRNVDLRPCTLEQGRWLIREALDFNAWRGVQPSIEFQRHQLTINALLRLDGEVDESADELAISADLTPDEVVADLIGSWAFGDYTLVYALLATTHPQRRAQTRDEFVRVHRQWFDEARPHNLVLNIVDERPAEVHGLWVPGGMHVMRQDRDAFWSLALVDTPLGGQLEDLPFASLIDRQTGRHWYWTSYSLVQEPGGWRIAGQRDEAVRVQMEPLPELEKRIEALRREASELLQAHSPTAPGADDVWRHASRLGITALHHLDAVLVKLPLEEANYTKAATIAETFALYDRAVAYLRRAADRFPGRAAWLQRIADVQELTGERMESMGRTREADAWFEQALETWHQLEPYLPGVETQDAIAKLLIQLRRYDEAEAVLQRLREAAPGRAETYVALGALELARMRPQEALRYYNQAAQLNPDLPGLYYNLGVAYRAANRNSDAQAAYEEALRREPHKTQAMNNLANQYVMNGEFARARELLSRAVELEPNNALYRANLAAISAHLGDIAAAQRHLQVAEDIAPDLPQVEVARSLIKERSRR